MSRNSKDFPKCKDAKKESVLVKQYTPLVHKITTRYSHLFDYEDLFQDGMIGLIYAIRWYNEESGIPFEKTASLAIRTYILTAYKRYGTFVHKTPKEWKETGLQTEDFIYSLNQFTEDELDCIYEKRDIHDDLQKMLLEHCDEIEIDAVYLSEKEFKRMHHDLDYNAIREEVVKKCRQILTMTDKTDNMS